MVTWSSRTSNPPYTNIEFSLLRKVVFDTVNIPVVNRLFTLKDKAKPFNLWPSSRKIESVTKHDTYTIFLKVGALMYTAPVLFLSSEVTLNRPVLSWNTLLEILRVKIPFDKLAMSDWVLFRNSVSEITIEELVQILDSPCTTTTAAELLIILQLLIAILKQLTSFKTNALLWNARFEKVIRKSWFFSCSKTRP